MKKICAVSGVEFEITDEDLNFYEKMGVPVPTLCPEERLRRRLMWRNDRQYHKRICDHCGTSMISICYPIFSTPVYCNSCWWSENWDPLEYGLEFDFSRPFFEQFHELSKVVPNRGIINDNDIRSENSEYTQDCVNVKNCYLIVEMGDARDSLFSHQSNRSVELLDCDQVMDSELVYESIVSRKLYSCAFLQNCDGCSNCFFGYDLRECKNCFGCVNLRQKQYCFLNEQLTREQYFKKLKSMELGQYYSLEKLRKSFQQFKLQFAHNFANFKNCEDCSGNDLFNCKNVLGYGVFNSQDSRFVSNMDSVKYVYDGQGWKTQWCLETQTCDESWMTKFSTWCENCRDIDYCAYCYNSSHDLFGCIGLKHAQYCILNKQYSKEEYFKLRDKIIEHMKKTGEWGEFFPIGISPFAYNETVAQEYFPMTKEEVLAKGWGWREESKDKACLVPSTTNIPDNISDVSYSICNEILECECCSKNYKIQKAELKFYRKMNLPIPHKCPDCRHAERIKLRNPRKLWERTCDKCGVDIQTTFAPERPEKVYCEKCYLDEVN